jgi:serine/threonine protein kinase
MTAPDSKTTPGVTPDAPTVSQQAAQAPDTQTSPVRVGSTMIQLPAQFGRYRLEKLLGKGGMGVVYLAHDTQLDRRVALKMPTEALAEGVPRERFFREARAAATLSHPNLCPVYDIGELDGVYYLTMPFIEGRPLSDYLQAKRPMPASAAAGLCRVLARALHEAHEHGVCHRDLKPANILINRKKQPVITDFGLARRTSAADERLTQTGAVLGTPAYMSPEQVNGTAGALGPKCDVYALGVILYELLTQRRPFSGPLGVMLARIVVGRGARRLAGGAGSRHVVHEGAR